MLIALKKSNAVRNDELIYLLAGGAKEKLQRREHDVPDERADAVRRRAHHGPHRPPPPWNRRPYVRRLILMRGRGERAQEDKDSPPTAKARQLPSRDGRSPGTSN